MLQWKRSDTLLSLKLRRFLNQQDYGMLDYFVLFLGWGITLIRNPGSFYKKVHTSMFSLFVLRYNLLPHWFNTEKLNGITEMAVGMIEQGIIT